jgi:PAS domain S-box-containing protein
MNGLEAVRQLRKNDNRAKVVFLTMHADADLATEAFRAGASGYVLKHSAAEELIEAIRAVLEGRVYLTSGMQGGVLEAFMRGRLVRDENGEPSGFIGIGRDITERERSESALRESEQDLAEAQRIARLGNWKWDIVKDEVRWSPELYRILDLDPAETKPSKKTFMERVHPDDRPQVEECIAALLSKKEPFSIDHRIVLKDDSNRFLHSTGRLECDAAGKPIRLYGIAQDITERKKSEAELKVKDSAIESSINGIGITDMEGKLIYVNDSCVEMWGYASRAEILGRFLPEFWEGEGVLKTIEELREKGGSIGEDIGKRKDGSLFPVQFSASLIRDEAGYPLYMFGSFIDISERKRAEEERRQAELNYRTVADFTYDWEYWEDPDGKLRYVSPSCDRISGYETHAFCDNPSLFRDIILPEDRKVWDKHKRDYHETLERGEAQFRIRARGGEVKWIEHVCQPVRGPDGTFLGFRASNRDISARKIAEETARQRERSLVDAQRIAHLGNWEWDIVKDEATRSNEVYRIFGLTPQQIEPTYAAFLERVHPDDRDMVRESVQRALAEPSSGFDTQFRIVRPDGAVRVVHEQGEVTVDDDGRPIRVIGTMHDITLHKQAEETLRNLAGRLLKAREEERKRIARELHDDVNQKLAALAMELSRFKQSAHLPEGKLRSQALHLQKQTIELCNDVRRLSHRLHPAILEHVGLAAALRSYCTELSKNESFEVRVSPTDELGPIHTEIALTLYRVAQESLRNVAKHSRATEARVSLAKLEDGIHLSVSDNGVGFDVEEDRQREGLGLVSMEERVRLLNGVFRLESRRGGGTQVEVTIPLGAKRS